MLDAEDFLFLARLSFYLTGTAYFAYLLIKTFGLI
tara:strand:- start:172 stop:276 length:105 start_codon:yes stop_codon:yes gene_type:complete